MKNLFTDLKNYRSTYIVNYSEFHNIVDGKTSIALPLVADSEFVAHGVEKFLNNDFQKRSPVTVQVKHTHHDDAAIYVHYEFAENHYQKIADRHTTPYQYHNQKLRHPVINHEFIAADYLESNGYTVELSRDDGIFEREIKPPLLLVPIYAYFAIADLGMVVCGDFLQDLEKSYANGSINMGRRLIATSKTKFSKHDHGTNYKKMPWIIKINGFEYQIALHIVDAGAIHGIAKYADFCSNSGILLDSKNLIGDWISKMDQAYFEVPEIFDPYALGDLFVYDALVGNAKNMRVVYNALGVVDYFKDPKLSIGATAVDMLTALIYKKFNLDPLTIHTREFNKKEFLEPLTGKATSSYLSTEIKTHAFLLSKCVGGRCKSNNPTAMLIAGNLVDIDISGAYSDSMTAQKFAFGSPVIYATPYGEKSVKTVPLKSVLHALKNELVDGLWTIAFNAKNLAYDQDLIASWIGFEPEIFKRIGGGVDGEVDVTNGETKIFMRDIQNGILTSDLLDVIEQWTPRHRDDFLEKCEVLAIAFYPKSLHTTFDQFVKSKTKKSFKTRSEALENFELITQCNHQWCDVWLGEFFTDMLRANRVQHDKKSPLNGMFKLLGNTSYGVSVSRFFTTANVIVGNNITARARSAMWMIEKSLNLYGSITDGQVFDVQNVLHRKNGYLHTEKLARLYNIDKRQIYGDNSGHIAPLSGIESIDFNDANEIQDLGDSATSEQKARLSQYQQTINKAALDHVAKVWHKSKMFNGSHRALDTAVKDGVVRYTNRSSVFEFEMKRFTKSVVLHGSSNYSFDTLDPYATKMRAYESKKPHKAFVLENNELTPTSIYDGISPALMLLGAIEKDPTHVPRLPPYVKAAILKPTAYSANYKSLNRADPNPEKNKYKWCNSHLTPADNILKTGKPNYFSLAQFTYNTYTQYTAWKKATDQLKRKYGESFEIFFSNDDDTIDYEKMIATIDKMICDGVTNPIMVFDKNRNRHRLNSHTATIFFEATKILKIELKECFVSGYDDDENMAFIDDSGE